MEQNIRKCNLIIWDDQLVPSARPMVAVSTVEPKPNTCHCADVMQEMWDKKKDKWKLKLVKEKKNVQWLNLFLIVSWVIFVVCYANK